MAFPTAGILDSGSGSNASPVGGNWTGPFYGDASSLQRSSNKLKGITAGGAAFNSAYWNPATFSPPCDIYYEIGTLPVAGESIWAEFISGTLSTPDGYGVTYQHGPGARPFQVYRLTSGTQTRLGPSGHTIPTPLAVGDAIGLSLDAAGVWTAYYRLSGVWTTDITGTDTTHTGPFNLGVELNSNTAAIVNFGGGSAATSTTYTGSGTAALTLTASGSGSFSTPTTITGTGIAALTLTATGVGAVVSGGVGPPGPPTPGPTPDELPILVGSSFADALYPHLEPMDI